MLGNAVSIDFIEEINKAGLISERYTPAKRRPILTIAVLVSAVFHAIFLYAIASDLFHNKRADSAVSQPIDMQLQIVRAPAAQAINAHVDFVESAPEPEVLENIPRVLTAETTITAEATSAPSIDLSEDTIRNVVEKVIENVIESAVQDNSNTTAEYEAPLEGPYANGFDARFRQKLIDSQNREPPPEEPELASWTTGSGQTVAQISESHCIRSASTPDSPARSVGALGGGGTSWGLPYKCGKDAGDRMMDRVNASLSDYLR